MDAPTMPTRVLAGVVVPDTPSITQAWDYARHNSAPYLFNHVARSWLFAARLGPGCSRHGLGGVEGGL
jgi:hypothetical protein